jgi:predicted alpha/beta-hydrolase family hydrolase
VLSVYSSDHAAAGLILAHGAGAGQHSGFMVEAGKQLSARGVTVATFDFPYIAAGRKAPDRAPVLEDAWRRAIAEARAHEAFHGIPLAIGGKSMGGRIASHVAAQGVEGVSGLVFLGYPLHPPGRPQQRRDAHLPDITLPMLFVQGSRDEFGTAADIRELVPRLDPRAQIFEVADGNHSFKVRVKTVGRTQDAVLSEIFDRVDAFVRGLR